MAVVWEVLDLEAGDVLAAYDTYEAAAADLTRFVDEHPEREDDLGLAAIDETTGMAVGEIATAGELVGATHA